MNQDKCMCSYEEYKGWQGSLGRSRCPWMNVCPVHSPEGHMLMTPFDATWPSSCECGKFHGRPHEHLEHVAQVLAAEDQAEMSRSYMETVGTMRGDEVRDAMERVRQLRRDRDES